MNNLLSGKANTSHTHSTSQITSGTLPVTRGGTGVTSLDALKSALGVGSFKELGRWDLNSIRGSGTFDHEIELEKDVTDYNMIAAYAYGSCRDRCGAAIEFSCFSSYAKFQMSSGAFNTTSDFILFIRVFSTLKNSTYYSYGLTTSTLGSIRISGTTYDPEIILGVIDSSTNIKITADITNDSEYTDPFNPNVESYVAVFGV